jgi:hypothetical protein
VSVALFQPHAQNGSSGAGTLVCAMAAAAMPMANTEMLAASIFMISPAENTSQ